MPKIRKIEIWFGGYQINTNLEYSSKHMFFVRIPDEYAKFCDAAKEKEDDEYPFMHRSEIGGGKRAYIISGDTEQEVISLLDKYKKIYEKLSTQVKKVIAYDIDYRSKNVSWNKGTYQGDDAADLSINFIVLNEYSVGPQKTYTDKDGRKAMNRFDSRNWKIIDWTEDREKFFSDLYGALEDLMQRIGKFLGTPEQVIKAVESRIKLLPRGGEGNE